MPPTEQNSPLVPASCQRSPFSKSVSLDKTEAVETAPSQSQPSAMSRSPNLTIIFRILCTILEGGGVAPDARLSATSSVVPMRYLVLTCTKESSSRSQEKPW